MTYSIPHRLRCLLSTLAAGCAGVSVVAFYAALGWGLLGVAQRTPRDPYLLVLVLVQWLVACGAVVATVELARLQRLWLDLPTKHRLARVVTFLLLWLIPSVTAFGLGSHSDQPARTALLIQGVGFFAVTILSELKNLTMPIGFPSSPLRGIFRLLHFR